MRYTEDVEMVGTGQVLEPTSDDLRLLAYAQHMARTARSEVAKHLFEEYLEQELKWLNRQPMTRSATRQTYGSMTSAANNTAPN